MRKVIAGTLSRLDRTVSALDSSHQKPNIVSQPPPARPESTSRLPGDSGSLRPPINYSNSSTTPVETTNMIPNGYAPVAGSAHHYQMSYPQASQYEPYTDADVTAAQTAYSHQNNFVSGIKVEEASDLVRFARQATQADAQTSLGGHNIYRQEGFGHYAGPQAWNTYAADAVDNFGMSDPFPINALMQLGAGDMNGNGMGNMPQDVQISSGHMGHNQFVGDMSSIPSWPQTVFNMPNPN